MGRVAERFRVVLFALLLLRLLFLPSGAWASSVVPELAPLGQTLPTAYTRSARLWPRVNESGFDGRQIAASLERREVRAIQIPSKLVPPADILAGDRRHESFDPREAIYRSFRIGRDTLRFTYGHMAEEFGGVPRLILSSPGGPPRTFPLSPLAHWNVDAAWYAGDYLIFGCMMEPEGVGVYEQIALWHLPSGRWYTTPKEQSLAHRGFKLRAVLEDWRTASAGSGAGSVVLQGRSATLVLTPRTGTWALVDKTGKKGPPPEHAVARKLIPVTSAMSARLRAPLLAAFREWNPGVDSVRILEVVLDPCLAHRGAALVAVGTAPEPPLRGPNARSVNEVMNSELFGVFFADSALGSIQSKVDMFATSRLHDYVVYFDLESADDLLAVWGQGETYGDAEAQRTYPCRN